MDHVSIAVLYCSASGCPLAKGFSTITQSGKVLIECVNMCVLLVGCI